MCGRFAQVFVNEDLEHIERILNQDSGLDQDLIELFAANYKPSYNTPPTGHATIVHSAGNRRAFTQGHFGLIPSWAKDRSRSASMNNARSETITAKVSFRDLFRSSRCLLPISGFYEWQPVTGAKAKQPWYIARADQTPMMVAGIWTTWLDPEHGHCEVDSFAIITTNANSMMSKIHHRMPVIIEPESINLWLDHTNNPREIHELMSPAADGLLASHPVSTKVNSTSYNDPSVICEINIEPTSLWGS